MILVDLLDHVNRDTDGPPFVRDGARNGLPYPPRRVRRELEALGGIELLRRPDEPEVALLNEVEKGHPTITILLGDGDHEPQIGFDETVFGPLAPAGYAVGEPDLIGVGKQRHPAYLREIHPDRVARRDGVGDLDRGSLRDVHGRYRRLGPRDLRVALDQRDLLFLQRLRAPSIIARPTHNDTIVKFL